ncbi:MAG TPA: hypothetical protein VGU24_15200 [Microvirga sp.]|jgi:hypothetical protein|nr:hypothetical protein [Microvirga sp.]
MIAALKKAAAMAPKVPNLEFRPGMPSAEVERLLEVARTDADSKTAALETARSAYRDDPSLERKHLEMAAEVERDVAAKQVERLERELDAAQEREAEAERQKRYDTAAAHSKAIPDLLKQYDQQAAALAALAARIVEGDKLIEAANRDLPKDADRLRLMEEHRVTPSSSKRVTRRREGWMLNGQPYRGAVMINERGQTNVHGVTRGTWTEEVEEFTLAHTPKPILTALVLPAVDGPHHWPRQA